MVQPSLRSRREDALVIARSNELRQAVWWCALSVAWAVLAGATALIAGLVVGSVALMGSGADSIVDGSASAVLVWRFGAERSRASHGDAVERRAVRLVGGILVLIGVYLAVAALVALAKHSRPEHSAVGVALTAASIVVLPVLARAKLQLSKQLGSSALRGDGVLSLAGAALAAATLVSLVAESAFGWWWADGVAALLIAGTLLREGFLISLGKKQAISLVPDLYWSGAWWRLPTTC
jgi:divalent metal cation (Fe/Co/Zn/Cd) transporter